MGGTYPPPLTAAWCRTGVDIEPRQLSGRHWQGRAGGEAAERLLREARQSGTAKKYARVLQKWMKFNEEGYMGQPYDPMVFTIAKWWLFAGWMMNPAENNDKDLNVVRSAINRYMEDNGRERPVLGFSVAQVIKVFKMKMEDAKRERGEEVGLNRVPCPEAALLRVFELGEVVEGLQLRQVACQLLQLLGWFRAATVAGMQAGDVWFDANGNLNIWARHVKMRPELKEQPALLTIPPGTGYRHVRCRAFWILQRAFDRVPGWPTYLSSQVPPGRDDGAAAARIMTADLRELVSSVLQLPDGASVSSHSWREMAAVSGARAGHCMYRMSNRGLWRRIETMLQSYIRPFEHFPYSAVLAELYDDLSASAPMPLRVD